METAMKISAPLMAIKTVFKFLLWFQNNIHLKAWSTNEEVIEDCRNKKKSH